MEMNQALVLICTIGVCTLTAAEAQCSSEPCMSFARQEFQPEAVSCAQENSAGCSPACLWRILDLNWCAVPTGNASAMYTIFTKGSSGSESEYTKECRAFIDGGGHCQIQNITAARHQLAGKDIGLATAAVSLEVFQFVTVVVLKYNEVEFCQHANLSNREYCMSALPGCTKS